MRLTISLLLVISTIFLVGCNSVYMSDECATFDRIEFQKETKDWLSGLEWPGAAYEDFDQVRKHNQKWEQRCGE
jgi:hypothetical protein